MNTADIQPVPEPYGGKILTWKTLLIGNLLTLLPLLLFVAGMVRAGMAAFEWLEDAQRPGAKPVGQVISSLVLIGLGLLSAGLAAYMVFRNTTKIANWYLKRKVRKAFRWRPDCNVDPDDPEATFVEVVPRQNWGKLMLETATDVGFLLVDEARREVRFEGDRERWRVPGNAIVSCRVEGTSFVCGSDQVFYYFTVLSAHLPSGALWEAPFCFRGDFGVLGKKTRQERAQRLTDRILDITGLDQSSEPAAAVVDSR